MTSWMFGTNIASHIIKGDRPEIIGCLAAIAIEGIVISSVTEREFWRNNNFSLQIPWRRSAAIGCECKRISGQNRAVESLRRLAFMQFRVALMWNCFRQVRRALRLRLRQ